MWEPLITMGSCGPQHDKCSQMYTTFTVTGEELNSMKWYSCVWRCSLSSQSGPWSCPGNCWLWCINLVSVLWAHWITGQAQLTAKRARSYIICRVKLVSSQLEVAKQLSEGESMRIRRSDNVGERDTHSRWSMRKVFNLFAYVATSKFDFHEGWIKSIRN